MIAHIDIGRPEGKTRYSGYAEQRYEQQRGERTALSSAEFTMVMEGYLHDV